MIGVVGANPAPARSASDSPPQNPSSRFSRACARHDMSTGQVSQISRAAASRRTRASGRSAKGAKNSSLFPRQAHWSTQSAGSRLIVGFVSSIGGCSSRPRPGHPPCPFPLRPHCWRPDIVRGFLAIPPMNLGDTSYHKNRSTTRSVIRENRTTVSGFLATNPPVFTKLHEREMNSSNTRHIATRWSQCDHE